MAECKEETRLSAPSDRSWLGTFGGALAPIQRRLSWQPLLRDTDKVVFFNGMSNAQDLVGTKIQLLENEAFLYGGYCRHGEYLEQLSRIAMDTPRGRRPVCLGV